MALSYRSKAPLRLGLAGGGTDVSPYSELYGGAVLNVTVNLYAHCTLRPRIDDQLIFRALDLNEFVQDIACAELELDGALLLHKAVYNRVVRDYNGGQPLAVEVLTWTDVPMGSGLGTSSTLVVAMLSAYREWLQLPLGEYDLAHLAYEIERLDCGLSGGKQDQYAAAFGGINFIEFFTEDRVIVNPLRIRLSILNELQSRCLLYYTGRSRSSARIIEDQMRSVAQKGRSIEAMHELKRAAIRMKEHLLRNQIDALVDVLRESWEAKKATSEAVMTPELDDVIQRAEAAGVEALKLSGAGGGGFMLMLVQPERTLAVRQALANSSGAFYRFEFSSVGETSWVFPEGIR